MQSFLKQYESIPVKEELNHVAKDPLVSVAVQTYQHAPYIVQCLDGVLMQKTTFPVEILLGEDDSSDGTREICLEYAQKYPDKIRLFLHHRENNIKIGGKPTGRFNLLYNFSQARGKYIALCEGDDYWTDPLKLQKQVDLLEAHPEYSMCFHSVAKIYENGRKIIYRPFGYHWKKFYTKKDLLLSNFIPTCSAFFRNNSFNEFPDWYYQLPMGDRPLYILNAEYGNIGYIDEVMGVYRIHSGGIWSGTDEIITLYKIIEADKSLDDYFEHRYHKIINAGIYFSQYRISLLKGNRRNAFSSLIRCFILYPFHPEVMQWGLHKILLELFFPKLYYKLQKFVRIQYYRSC